MEHDARDDRRRDPAPVRIPANVSTYYLEEMAEVIPTQVMYDYDDHCWWNLSYVYDTLCQHLSGQKLEPMSKFVRSLAELVSAEHAEEHLGNRALYVKPSNVEGGFGLKSKDQLFSMLEVCVCCGIIPKQK